MKKQLLPLLAIACTSLLTYSLNASACPNSKCSCVTYGVKGNSIFFTVGGGQEFFASKRRAKNTSLPFVGAGYNFTDNWGIEALVGFFNTHFTGDLDNGKETNGNLVLVDASYHFAPYRFVQPYLLAGVGVTSFSSNRTDANNQGNINAGVGLQFHVNQVVSFKVDARDIYTMVGGKNDVFLSAGVSFAMQLC